MPDPSAPSARRFLEASFGRAVDRPPVWMMRQAGRYLPEYREVRRSVTFDELCRNPDLAAVVSLQPYRRFRPDAVIFFSDILVTVAAMGAVVEFTEHGPRLPAPVRSGTDVERLSPFDPSREVGFMEEILRILRSEVGDSAAVLGFAGAPWTLAAYLVEGGGSKSFAAIKAMMLSEPATLRRLLERLADAVAEVASYQLASGAQAVQLFDTWAGELSEEDYRAWALPAVVRAIDGIRRPPAAPVILYVNGCAHLFEAMAESGADVLSIDWRLRIGAARDRIPGAVLQGNLDPAALTGPPEEVSRRVREMVAQTGGARHIVNLGHGVSPEARLESVEAFFETARAPMRAAPAVAVPSPA